MHQTALPSIVSYITLLTVLIILPWLTGGSREWRVARVRLGADLSVMVFPCVSVCGYPVRTECGNACGS